MDCTIALIFPSKPTCRTAESVLAELGLDYPVRAASCRTALEIAHELIAQGTRMIISHGATYDFMCERLDISMLELPFSGLEAAAAVRTALQYAENQTAPVRIVHMARRCCIAIW